MCACRIRLGWVYIKYLKLDWPHDLFPVMLWSTSKHMQSESAALWRKNQQSDMRNTLQGSVVLWVLPSFNDKTLNPETPCSLNSRSGLCSSCLHYYPGIYCSHVCKCTWAHTHIFSARMTVNKVLKHTAVVLQHGRATYGQIILCVVMFMAWL